MKSVWQFWLGNQVLKVVCTAFKTVKLQKKTFSLFPFFKNTPISKTLFDLPYFIRALLLGLKIGSHLYFDDDANRHQLNAANDQQYA